MKVYISAHHPDPANDLAAVLTGAGHTIVSTWHTETAPRPAADDGAAWGEKAKRNCAQIDGAEALVCVASPDHVAGTKRVPGGKFVEAGYALNHALGSGGPLVVTLGGVENGMLWHPGVQHVKDAAELVELLA